MPKMAKKARNGGDKFDKSPKVAQLLGTNNKKMFFLFVFCNQRKNVPCTPAM